MGGFLFLSYLLEVSNHKEFTKRIYKSLLTEGNTTTTQNSSPIIRGAASSPLLASSSSLHLTTLLLLLLLLLLFCCDSIYLLDGCSFLSLFLAPSCLFPYYVLYSFKHHHFVHYAIRRSSSSTPPWHSSVSFFWRFQYYATTTTRLWFSETRSHQTGTPLGRQGGTLSTGMCAHFFSSRNVEFYVNSVVKDKNLGAVCHCFFYFN